ncbi:MAG: MFS transporter [Acidobacteriota bacterium]|nr:MFS transporter [Acidobacteriota bacterium]
MKNRGQPEAETPGYIEILRRYPAYRHMYLARLISMLGDWISLIALFELLREVTGGNAKTLGALIIVKMLPPGLMGPFAGVVADRFSRKTIMIVSDLARFVLVLGYFLVPLFPNAAVPMVLTIAFTQACASAFFDPSRTALLPSLVPVEALATANALGAVTWSITYTLGSLLGGVLTWAVGWQGVLVIDALSFLVSAFFLFGMQAPVRERKKSKLGLLGFLGITDLIEGFRFIKGHPRITYTIFLKTGLMLGGSMMLVLTLFAQRLYPVGGPQMAVGIFMAVRALGTAVGPILCRRWIGNDLERSRKVVLGGLLLAGVFYALVGLSDQVAPVLIFVFVSHLGSSVAWVFSTVILQRLVPDEYAGRVFAAELAMATLMVSLSNDLTGRAEVSGLLAVKELPIALGVLVFSAGLFFMVWGQRPKLRGKFRDKSPA